MTPAEYRERLTNFARENRPSDQDVAVLWAVLYGALASGQQVDNRIPYLLASMTAERERSRLIEAGDEVLRGLTEPGEGC